MVSIQTPNELGAALRRARKTIGLTQAQLALAARCGVRFIVEAEAGKPTLQLDTLLRVIHSLGGQWLIEGLPGDNEGSQHDA